MGNDGAPRSRKVPLRQCMGCRERKEKKNLVRIVRTAENAIEVDFTGRKNGRGAYVCNSLKCLELAKKRGALESSLKTRIPEETYLELEREMTKEWEMQKRLT